MTYLYQGFYDWSKRDLSVSGRSSLYRRLQNVWRSTRESRRRNCRLYKHLSGAFVFLSIGCFLSTIVFVLENIRLLCTLNDIFNFHPVINLSCILSTEKKTLIKIWFLPENENVLGLPRPPFTVMHIKTCFLPYSLSYTMWVLSKKMPSRRCLFFVY